MSNQAELCTVESRIQYELMACKAVPRSPSIRFSAHELELILARLAASAPAGDAVAWRYELADARFWDGETPGEHTNWKWRISETKPCVSSEAIRNLTPLYARPPAVEVREALDEKVVLDGIRDALETRGYFHMANGRDIGALLDALSAPQREILRKSDGEKLSGAVQSWGVSVTINGVGALTIESNCLSGAPNIDDYAGTVENCALHLLSFIGRPTGPSEPSPSSRSETAGESGLRDALRFVRRFFDEEATSVPNAHACLKRIDAALSPPPDCSGCKPPEVPTIDDVPSCGMENDWRRATPPAGESK